MTAPAVRRRVLFIEDEPAIQTSYERFFGDRYDARFASTGAEALAQLGTDPPDVVVLDMRLPDTDGIDLLRRIRAIATAMPVVITTAYMSVEPQLRVLDLAFTDYLLKPFDLEDLRTRIDAAR
ncbi:MAG: response regulator [Gemmatimonadota bacterium]